MTFLEISVFTTGFILYFIIPPKYLSNTNINNKTIPVIGGHEITTKVMKLDSQLWLATLIYITMSLVNCMNANIS